MNLDESFERAKESEDEPKYCFGCHFTHKLSERCFRLDQPYEAAYF